MKKRNKRVSPDGNKSESVLSVEFLSKYGIEPTNILCQCHTDLDGNCNYRQGLLLLCEDSLYIIKNKNVSRGMHFENNDYAPIQDEPEVDIIPLDNIRDIAVETKIASVTVVATVNGAERLIANASNHCAVQVRRLVRMLERKSDKCLGELPCDGSGAADSRDTPPETEAEREPRTERPPVKKITGTERRSLFIRLLGFFKPYRASVLTVLACFAATSIISLLTPYLSGTVLYGQVLDGRLAEVSWLPSKNPVSALAVLMLTMLAVKALTQIFSMLHSYVTAKFVPKVVRDIKNQVFSAMNRLSISFFASRQTGMLMTRVLDDADQVTMLFIDMLPSVIVGSVTIVVAVIVMFLLDARLAIAAVILLPISGILSFLLMSRLWTLHGRQHRATRRLSSAVNDNIGGARVVRAFGKQQDEMQRFSSANAALRNAQVDIVNAQSKLTAVFSFLSGIAPMLVSALAGYLILAKIGDMDYSKLITFTGYIGTLAGPFDSLSSFLREWVNCMNSAQRIFEIIDAKPEVAESETPVRLRNIRGDVELRDVCFAYEKGNPVLTDVSFTVRQGEMLGIVGRSGAGKSTLLNLITRLYDADEGQVLIDGVDIRDIAMADLRGLVAMVSQETYIFMGTVAENIAYACPNATPDDIVSAAKAACAHDFIMNLPDGYDTIIGTAGRRLSGGERQRISIARAVLVNPKILMLDEATAAVDTETEMNIQMALEQLIKGRTTISVAHRLSTLRDADELIVIENGKVAERGTHDELMAREGIYFKLAEIQRKALEYRGIGG